MIGAFRSMVVEISTLPALLPTQISTKSGLHPFVLKLKRITSIQLSVAILAQVIGAFRSMVVEISRGSVRHRGHLAASAPICLQPIPQSAWQIRPILLAFFTGAVLTFAVGLWWLFSLDI